MESLKTKILQHGQVLSEHLLNLDAILNHQVDPELFIEMGQEFATRFRNDHVTKVLTIEASGISIAFATALALGVPFVFARRKKTLVTQSDAYCERVPSFTKGIVTDIVVSRNMINPDDRILLIDDIIANGDAARGLMRIVRQSGANIIGWGIAVEKSFQAGGRTIRASGVRLESLVRIASLTNGTIQFAD